MMLSKKEVFAGQGQVTPRNQGQELPGGLKGLGLRTDVSLGPRSFPSHFSLPACFCLVNSPLALTPLPNTAVPAPAILYLSLEYQQRLSSASSASPFQTPGSAVVRIWGREEVLWPVTCPGRAARKEVTWMGQPNLSACLIQTAATYCKEEECSFINHFPVPKHSIFYGANQVEMSGLFIKALLCAAQPGWSDL